MNRRELDPTSSPLAALAVQLRRLREAKGLTQVEFGRLVRYSNVYISNVETGKQAPSLKFALRADAVLEANGSLELLWWSWKNSALIPGFAEYAPKEREAIAVRLFETDMVPGLLQHPEYAAAYESAPVRRGEATEAEAEDRLRLLAARQGLLVRAPAIHVVLDEGVLRRPIGGPQVMIKQLTHLEELAQRPNLILQVAPFTLAEDRPLSHSVTLLTLPNRTMVGYTESLHRGYLERDADTVAGWAGKYDRLQVDALNRADSLAMIREARKELMSCRWT
ncbi:helix-turn-helix domain-containing protein [Kitasatospora viridis]|uniref:DNA-binding XRE family transcriptional regulator n=1 Tax=Kitasatospora viridis TaxID=281105 RepID=A0A561ULR6_9ACTN|nr:helix-turn-helix transcriptional regulator [Kitasatospora viridis]TWG00289.1 DNA-binding XRE family transcriptional regulator [Kitasatospora viridis]